MHHTITTTTNMASVQDFNKMKVTELKKVLKEKGLALTGSKSELLERLTAAVQVEEDNLMDDTSAFFDDKLLDSAPETTANDDSILDDNVDLSEPSPPAKPALQTQKSTEPEEKTDVSPEAVEEDTEKKTPVTSPTMSDAERLKKRAERFGVQNEDTKKQLRAERFGGSTPTSKLSTSGGGASTDVLKKRAERFGQVVSPVLSKVDEAERMQKRKDRFGDLTSATNNGPSKPKSVKLNASSGDEEKLKKRAERFGLP